MTSLPLATYLAFDYGLRRIGVAVGQSITQSARPLAIVLAENGVARWDEIGKLIKAWRPAGIIVGVPYHMDGQDAQLADQARQFCLDLKDQFGLPIWQVDERLTSIAARERAFAQTSGNARQKHVDGIAAAIILEQWFIQQKFE